MGPDNENKMGEESRFSGESKRLLRESEELQRKHATAIRYIRAKVDQLLTVMGTYPLRPEELDDKSLIEMDPIGIISNSFVRVLRHLHNTNEKLKIANEEIQAIFDSAGMGILVCDTDFKITAFNAKLKEQFFPDKPDMTGRRCYEAICSSDYLPDNCPFTSIFGTGKSVRQKEWVLNGRYYDVVGSPIRDGNGYVSAIVLTYMDVTDRLLAAKEMLKTEKLESLGVLAGGIAHDFNNLLNAIMGNIDLALLRTGPGDEIRKRLLQAEKAAKRAHDLTNQLLTFSRGGAPVKKAASVAELIRDSAGFALRGASVRCEFSLPEDLWKVEIDEGQISQVINNLVLNAFQAMPGGGRIHISAENTTVGVSDRLQLKDGKYVKITIKDYGVGIPVEYLNRIFEPFFTTKETGTGLGLATTYSIVKSHGGVIDVESDVGAGTTFFIYLPAFSGKISEEYIEESLPFRVSMRRVLVMDDDDMVRDIVGAMLDQLGHETEFAVDGGEAVRLYKEAMLSGRPFDAVIIDLTIPGGMGGKEAVKKLREIDPQVRAIVSSGYSSDPIMANFREYGFEGVVVKPYKLRDLSEALRKVFF